MARSLAVSISLFVVLAFSSCGQDVIIDVDQLPTGNAVGASGSGLFNYYEVIKDSTCPADYNGVSLPAETDTWTTTATLTQAEGYFLMDIDGTSGHPDVELDGGIFWYGNYRIGGTYWWSESARIKFVNLMDGRFVDGVNDIKGEIKIRVMEEAATDPLDCELTVAFTGDRVEP